MDTQYQSILGRSKVKTWVLLFFLNRLRVNFISFEAGECFLHLFQNPIRATIVVVRIQFSIGIANVAALGRSIKVLSWTLAGDLSVKIAFRILLPSFVPLVDRDWDEIFLEEFKHFWIGKCQLTVEHAIVSGAAKWVAVH